MSTDTPPTHTGSSFARNREPAAVPAPGPGKFAPGQLLRFAAVAAELALLTLVIRTFGIESGAFFRVMAIACGGFVVHHLMPARLRMPFFVLLSFTGIVAVMGTANAAQIVGFGVLLIALAHLPIAFGLRVALILGVGGVLAAIRVNAIHTPVSAAIWPIFGAMFMFRLIVYLYDLHNRAAPVGVWRSLAYFFMLPNVCFPLFPVVDYKHFCRTYYDQADIRIYQTGVEWMFRGVLQLLLYRWVYQHMVGAESIVSALQAARFIVSAYLMYLKISGSFHLIVGLLHLFGFNLTQTNNRYFLSESFTDYWRRINIYWKDFLQKVFFNPFYFRLNKKVGETSALVLATLAAFFVTWALHSYQWFWIRGKFPVVWQDIVFWSIMGLLVLGNMLYETRHGRQRSLKKARSLRGEVMLALRTIGTFVVVCLSWVIWSSESMSELGLVLGRLAHPDALTVAWIVGALAALGVVAVLVARADGKKMGLAAQKKPVPFWGPAFRVGTACVAIMFMAYAPLRINIDPRISDVVDNLKTSSLNARDAQMLDRGYYEDLTNVVRFNSSLSDLYNQRPPNWERCWAMHGVDGYPDFELIPNKHVLFKGAMMTTNRWGMRDRDYGKRKPAGTYRIAILGASHPMGTGVGDDEVFDNVVEDRLNREHAAAGDGRYYELLNFSVGGYGPIQQLADFDKRVHEFEFDALLCTGIDDLFWITKDVIDAAQHNFPVPYEYVRTLIKEEGLGPGVSYAQAAQKLKPRSEDLLRWMYGELVARCKERGAVPMAGYIPHPRGDTPSHPTAAEMEVQARVKRQMELAREAGMVVIDMTDAYQGVASEKLVIAPWDSHPSALGHQLLAEKLYEGLKTQPGF